MTGSSATTPPLRPHDRLSRAEFERRFDATRGLKKAELLHGAVFVAEPVRHASHGRPDSLLDWWLGCYAQLVPGVDVGGNSSIRLEGDNMPQPDLLLRKVASRGGQSRIDEDGYIEGAPELVVEVAASTVSYDLHDKLEVYREFGVREYVVYRVEDGEIDWLVLRDGRYERAVVSNGTFRSEVFPGLWLDVEAVLRGDRTALRGAVIRGVEAEPQ